LLSYALKNWNVYQYLSLLSLTQIFTSMLLTSLNTIHSSIIQFSIVKDVEEDVKKKTKKKTKKKKSSSAQKFPQSEVLLKPNQLDFDSKEEINIEESKSNYYSTMKKKLGRINIAQGGSKRIIYNKELNSCINDKKSPKIKKCKELAKKYHATQNYIDRYNYSKECVDLECWDVGHCKVMQNGEGKDSDEVREYCDIANENEQLYGPITPYLNEDNFNRKINSLQSWIDEMKTHVQTLSDYLFNYNDDISLSIASDYIKLYKEYCEKVKNVLAKIDQAQYQDLINKFQDLQSQMDILFTMYGLDEWKTVE
jgi:hypothetical protein